MSDVVAAAVKRKVALWLAGVLLPLVLVLGVLGLVLIVAMSAISEEEGSSDATNCQTLTVPQTVTERQNFYAQIVIGVAKNMGFGDDQDRAITVALMTVSQESGFKNYANDGVWTEDRDTAVTSEQLTEVATHSQALPHDAVGTDNDSVGLFQQRPYAGWATYPGTQPGDNLKAHIQRLMNPVWQAQVFFLHLKAIPNWQSLSLGQAAQTVQVSAYPDAYADDEAVAVALRDTNVAASPIDLLPTAVTGTETDPTAPNVGDGTVYLCSGGTATGKAADVIAAARSQIGQPYSWGGGGLDGPSGGCGCAPYYNDRWVSGFDCSGLARYAIYQGTGVLMDRTASAQYVNTASWGFAQIDWPGWASLQPGDLVFWSNSSSPSDIYHVGIAAGGGMLVHAGNHEDGVVEIPGYSATYMFAVRPNYTDIEAEQ